MIRSVIFILAVLVVLGGTAYSQQKQPSLAEIVKAAEKEGEVVWRSGYKDNESGPFIKAFNKEYPNIKVIPERDIGADAMERLIREVTSGAVLIDVQQIHEEYQPEIIALDILEIVNWADLKVFPNLIRGGNRLVAGAFALNCIAFNTNLLKKEEAPKTWEDLLDPKWKGKFVVDSRPKAFLCLAGAWGPQKVLDYAKKLGQNNPIFVRGQSELAGLMGAGQYMLSAGSLVKDLIEITQKGGPVAWNFPDPVPAYTLDFAVMKKARHPNAAKVFIAWLGSKGYKLWDDINWGRGAPYGGTLAEKAVRGKTLSFTPSIEQVPDPLKYQGELIKALGVKK